MTQTFKEKVEEILKAYENCILGRYEQPFLRLDQATQAILEAVEMIIDIESPCTCLVSASLVCEGCVRNSLRYELLNKLRE